LHDFFEERQREPTRIAQELHDSLIQDVMGISLQIEVTDELLPANLSASTRWHGRWVIQIGVGCRAPRAQ
jgi:nitrate/nitrite-specific signal transduction histidine kinase